MIKLARDFNWLCDVEFLEAEAAVFREVLDIVPRARDQIVQAHHFTAVRQQPLAQVRADEAGGPGNKMTHS
jgi:hypothetical protein